MKTYSLTRRLILSLLLVQFIAALGVSGLAFLYERHEHFRALDIMLRGRADSLLGDVQDAEDKEDNVMLDGTQIALPREDLYLVQDNRGRLLGQSANWPAGLTIAATPPATPEFYRLVVAGRAFRALHIAGLRMVDPGDPGGGIPRPVTVLYGTPVDPTWAAIRRVVGFYALSSLAVLAVTSLLMAWLLDRGLGPLRHLGQAAATVSVRSWHFAAPAEALAIRELAPLANTLETVLGNLRTSFQQQEHFLSDAAHELKTATAVVKSSLQLLNMKPRSSAEYHLGLQRCEADCARMEAIVARMLTLARVESGVIPMPLLEATDLRAAAATVVTHLSSIADLHHVRLHLSADSPLPVLAEPEQLRTLCSNLLLNAIEHSLPGSSIEISLLHDSPSATLRIEDHGEGIPAEALPYVFDRFFRGDPSRSRNTGGSGLGLAISRAIVLQTAGEISLSSRLGQGTVVLVTLPLAGELQPSVLAVAQARHAGTPPHPARDLAS